MSDLFKNISEGLKNISNELNSAFNTGDSKKKKINSIFKYDIKMVEKFMSFEYKDNFSKAVKESFEVWKKMCSLQPENDISKISSAAFCQPGKISDSLKEILETAESINDEDAETLKKVIYGNYISFMRSDIKSMRDKYIQKKKESNKLYSDESDDVNMVESFIRSECGTVTALKNLSKIRKNAIKLANSDKDDIGNLSHQKLVGSITMDIDILKAVMKEAKNKTDTDDIKEIEAVTDRLYQRIQAMEENIEKGTGIYDCLTENMTDEWFDSFDPYIEDSPINSMTAEELKEFYIKKISEVTNELEKINLWR